MSSPIPAAPEAGDEPLAARRRRAAWRALHRGTKEMDLLLGRYAEAHLSEMPEGELTRFEELLALPDPDLQRWILSGGGDAAPLPGAEPAHEIADLVARLRRFHGLAPSR